MEARLGELQLLLRRPPFVSAHLFAVLAGALVVWCAHILSALDRTGFTLTRTLWVGLFLALPVGIALIYRTLTRPRFGGLISFHPQGILLPQSADSGSATLVPYRDLLSIDVRGRRPRAQLHVGTRQRLFVFPVGAFDDPDAAKRFIDEARRQIRLLPDGGPLLEQLERRGHVSWVAASRRPVVTFSVLALLAIVFLIQRQLGAFEHPFGLVRLGANAPLLVRDGQLYRLVSANFLHASFLHLYMNALALLVLGGLLERLLGRARFVVVLGVSALGGALASALAAQATYSVGASTAVFGLLGSLALLHWRFRGDLPGGFRQTARWWLCVLGLSTLLPVAVPQIDLPAHLGGFIGGALATWLLYRTRSLLRIHAPTTLTARSLAVGISCVVGLGVGAAGGRVLSDDRRDEVVLASALLEGHGASARTLHRVAADFARPEDASHVQLLVAQRAARRAAALEPNNIEILADLAAIHSRLGEHDHAVATQHRAIELGDTIQRSRQMAVYLRDLDASGERETSSSVDGEVRVWLEPVVAAAGPRAVRVELERGFPDGLVLYAWVGRPGRARGLFRVVVGPTPATDYRFAAVDHPLFDAWPDVVDFEIAYLDDTGSGYEAQAWRWQYWELGG